MAKEEKKTKKKKKEKKKTEKKGKDWYYEAEGRRKTSVARVRIWPKKKGKFIVNDKPLKDYFSTKFQRETALASLKEMNLDGKVKVSIVARGGGLSGQAEAIRHGTARALIIYKPEFKNKLKKAGYLTRDSRMRERKKFGKKRARKSPQWSKR